MKKSYGFSMNCIIISIVLILATIPTYNAHAESSSQKEYILKIEDYNDFNIKIYELLTQGISQGSIIVKSEYFDVDNAFEYFYSKFPEASYVLENITYKRDIIYYGYKYDINLKYKAHRFIDDIPILVDLESIVSYIKKGIEENKSRIILKNIPEKDIDVYQQFERILKEYPEYYYLIKEYSVTSFGTEENKIYQMDIKYSGNSIKNMVVVYNVEEISYVMKRVLERYENRITIKIMNYNKEDYDLSKIIDKVSFKYPDKCYGYKRSVANIYGVGRDKIIDLELNYNFTKEEAQIMNDVVESKLQEIIDTKIQPDMDDFEKELILHDYLVHLTRFDIESVENDNVPSSTRTIYGVLVNKSAVCEGYARTFKKLLDMVGIENYIVIGEADGTPHVWNMVNIQGEYYHVDVTWDDPVIRSGEERLSHKYFNVTDEFISQNHIWDKSEYFRCNSREYSYIKVKRDIVAKYIYEKYSF